MGECADMVLDGILDWDGSYSGNRSGGYSRHSPADYSKVFGLFKSWSIKKERRWPIIHAYGQFLIKQRQLKPKEKINFLSEAANNWKEFKKFVADNKNTIFEP